jgi:hypothetical protein
MAQQPKVDPAVVVTALERISGRISQNPQPGLGKFLIELVKNRDALERFRADPAAALKVADLQPAGVNVRAVETLALSVIARIAALGPGVPVLDAVSTSETSQSQDRNFDHSSSWFTNYDGWNVMHDAGHSSDQSSGSTVGQDKNFSGFTTVPGEAQQAQLALFYPGQPLVSPELVAMIKAAVAGVE